MPQLPPEIAHQICAHLGEKDIQTLRLSCRFWRDIAACHLFPSLKLTFTQSSFKRLRIIFEDPRFRRGVKHLIFDSCVLKDKNREQWENGIYEDASRHIHHDDPSLSMSSCLSRRILEPTDPRYGAVGALEIAYTPQDLENAWAIYQKYLQEQKDLIGIDYASSEICEIINQLPMLREVSLHCRLDKLRTWPEGREDALGWTPSQESAVSQVPTRNQNFSCSPGPCQDEITNLYGEALAHICQDADIDDLIGASQIISLLLALHRSEVKLKELDFGPGSWGILYEDEDTFQKIMQMMNPIEMLVLRSNCHADIHSTIIPRPRPSTTQERLGRLLAAAPNLTCLDISCPIEGRATPTIDFGAVVQNVHWPRLHTLKLGPIALCQDTWLEFLKRHSTTLRRLSMDSISLRIGIWEVMFERMRGWLRLEKVVLAGRWWSEVHRQPTLGLDPRYEFHENGTITQRAAHDAECLSNEQRWRLQDYLLHRDDGIQSSHLQWILQLG